MRDAADGVDLCNRMRAKGFVFLNAQLCADLIENRVDYTELVERRKKLKEEEDDSAQPFEGSAAQTKKEKGAPAPAASRLKTHVVQEGETLTSIARRFYGSGKHWRKIQEANRAVISVDGKVDAGTEIALP